MNDKLQEICDYKREVIKAQQASISYKELNDAALFNAPVRGFAKALDEQIERGKFGLIAEIKKASPSAGVIRLDFNPVSLAHAYEQGGAACLSILTDEKYFQGHSKYLLDVHESCPLPILRKDFMIDVWQIIESRAIGADCVLLIMAAIDDALALDLYASANYYNMDVLIEVHDEDELERALRLPTGLIGINNRNLKTLRTDLSTTERLAPLVPQDRVIVCESGIKTNADLQRMKNVGALRFLVGETLMTQPDIAEATANLLGL
jgi:indole-3-glycerol phosphate synthase